MNNRKKVWQQFFLLPIFLIILITLTNCKDKKCSINEYYPNGNPKLQICVLDKNSEYNELTEYFDNGQMKSNYFTIKGQVNGVRSKYFLDGNIKSTYDYKDGLREGLYVEYFPDGKVKIKCNYKKDLQNGNCLKYLQDGKINFMNYCINGQTVYGKFYTYGPNGESYQEGYNPIINLINKDKDSLFFSASLPIPDSISDKSSSILKYGLKPMSLKDSSVILDTEIKVQIVHSETYFGKISLKGNENQLLYGYLLDEEKEIIYNSFELPVTDVLRLSNEPKNVESMD